LGERGWALATTEAAFSSSEMFSSPITATAMPGIDRA